MAIASAVQTSPLESKLRFLGERVDTRLVDDVFDEILNQLGTLKSVSCTLSGDSSLLLRSHEKNLTKVALPRAKTILRLMCARLAVRAAEWAQKEVSPYGDSVTCEVPLLNRRCTVGFENTPAAQWFEITGERQSRQPPRRRKRTTKKR
jgi:hypothetical protein